MKKFAKTLMSTLSILGCASYLYAVPTLVISDNNGNTTGVIPVPTGTTTFSGVLGNWNFNVVTVIGAPPAAGSTTVRSTRRGSHKRDWRSYKSSRFAR